MIFQNIYLKLWTLQQKKMIELYLFILWQTVYTYISIGTALHLNIDI